MEGIDVTVGVERVGCDSCDELGFVDAIEIEDGRTRITARCRGCSRCVEACTSHAIAITFAIPHKIENTVRRIEESVDVR